MKILKVLEEIVFLDTVHQKEIEDLIEVKHYKKNERFLIKGDLCKSIGFVG